MSAAPRYSVLLPTHNRAEVIGLAIASVLQQTFTDFELLVVGDGCTDDTGAVVQSFADERVSWLDLPKAPGFGYANRNSGLRSARGSLVAFMAHDDLWLSDHLELLAQPFDHARVEWAYSRPVWVADEGAAVPFPVDLADPGALAVFLGGGNTIPASCVVYRRECHDRVGMWNEAIAVAGDWDLWQRIVAPDGANIGHVRTPTTLHFRAAWKPGAGWAPPPFAAWLRSAAAPWWPADLRNTIPAGASPQAALWQAISEDPTRFNARLRAGADAAVDRLAWRAGTAEPATAGPPDGGAGGQPFP